MKDVKNITILLGLIALGVLGYYIYTSIQEIDSNQAQYNFEPSDDIYEYDPEEGETEVSAELELNQNTEINSEEEFEAQIQVQEIQQDSVEKDLEELEAKEF